MNQQSHLRARFTLDNSGFIAGLAGIQASLSLARRSLSATGVSLLAFSAGLAGIGYILAKSVSQSAFFESAEVAFEILLKSADKAHARIAELSEFARVTPFNFTQVIQASRTLQVMTEGALATGKGLRLVGDAASVAQQPIEDVALWFGRLHDGLMSGRAIGKEEYRLEQMGILSGKVRNQLDRMGKAGAPGKDMWNVVVKSLEKFDGAMEKMSHTWEGLVSNMQDAWQIFMGKLGNPIRTQLKPFLDMLVMGIQVMIGKGEGFGQSIVASGKEFLAKIEQVIGLFSQPRKMIELWVLGFKYGMLDAMVKVKDAFQFIMGHLAQAFDLITHALSNNLSGVMNLAGVLLKNAFQSVVPRLWDGMKSVLAGISAGLMTGVEAMIGVLSDGLEIVINWFSQGWTKAVWEPIKALGAQLGDLARSFGMAMYNFLTGAYAKGLQIVDAMKNTAKEGAAAFKISRVILGHEPKGFQEHYTTNKAMLDAIDPLRETFTKMQEEGDAGMKTAMDAVRGGAGAVLNSVKDFFHLNGGPLESARTAAARELQGFWKSLQPVGATALSKLIQGWASVPGRTGKGAWAPMGDEGVYKRLFKNPAPSWGSSVLGGGGLGLSLNSLTGKGGLITGGLQGSRLDPNEKHKEQDRVHQESQVDLLAQMRDQLNQLLGVTEEAWGK